MKTIIAPVDFSAASLSAARYAVDFARSLNGQVILFHASMLPSHVLVKPLNMTENPLTYNDATDRLFMLGEYLLKYADYKVKVDTVIKKGDLIPELENYCYTNKPYAIVMGSSGSTATENVLFGSKTLQAVKTLVWPIVVVPVNISFKNISKIAIACDLTSIAETVHTDLIKRLVKDLHALLYIVYVHTETESRISHEKADSSAILKDELAELGPEFHFIHHENLQQGLTDFSRRHNIDLLIMMPKKHKMLENLIFKSHSKQAILHAQLPIMCIHE